MRSAISWKAWLAQALVLAVLLAAGAWTVHNTQSNLAARGLSAGYDFLAEPAGFALGAGPLPYEPGDSYLRAFAAGVANTVLAAVPAILLATALGFALGIASISRNTLLRGVVGAYVDVIRNIPLLVQVLLWYFSLTQWLPDARSPLSWGPIYLSKDGLALPNPISGELPSQGAFGPVGGLQASPELMAIVGALAAYAAAYCAEIVRAGLQAVPRGQWEAAHALGLRRGRAIRLVVMPQAMRLIVPPYISLVLNTIKNSSLGVAIGYPEIVSVATTSLNQNGRAIECISLVAAVYLLLNLLTSAGLNLYNRRAQIKER
jgi:general L-amino acid transport system permease protein